jgi:hypothetical protein
LTAHASGGVVHPEWHRDRPYRPGVAWQNPFTPGSATELVDVGEFSCLFKAQVVIGD